MQIIEWPEFLENGLPLGENFSSLTVGVFDGVHLGHQALIRRVVSFDRNNFPAAITFVQNHKKARGGIKEYPGDIHSFRQKIAMFERMGLAVVIAAEFTESFRQMPGNEFMRILLDRCRMGFLAVGSDFHCGHRLDTDASAIRRFFADRNIPVEIVADVIEDSKPVSSSRIRDAIVQGRLEYAQAMLGYPFTLDLGAGGMTDGISRIGDQGLVLPPEGRYPVILRKKPEEEGTVAEILVENGNVRVLFSKAVPSDLSEFRWEFAEFVASE